MADAPNMQTVSPHLGERWTGYGRWSAPYWFVGLTPVGDDDPVTFNAWQRLAPLDLDAVTAEHEPRWATEHPPLDRARAEFSRLVLGYEDAPCGQRDVERDQRQRLGRSDGAALLIDLPAEAARERDAGAVAGLATLRRRLREHGPRFVVFYGTAYRTAYQAIAGAPFDDTGYVRSGPTLCTLVRHPAARPALPTAWWGAKGRQIRQLA